MPSEVKSKIYQLVDSIGDEEVLQQVMEDVAFYASKKDAVDLLTPEQLAELDATILEVDSGETITWNEFKKDMNEWRKRAKKK
jgi:Arc/MetJ family transcription regulator